MLAKIDGCGAGLNTDLAPEELGNGVWSSVENMRFTNGFAERFLGTTQVFSAPSVTPYWLAPYATTTTKFWIHAGTNAVFADDGVTRTDITGTAPTGTSSDRWTGGTINGVFIMNNGVDVPMYWAGDTATNLTSIPGWDATWRCKALRPFKNFIIALNVTKGTANYPHMVKWSTTLNPGSITSAGDWDETDPTKDAGEQDLGETSDLMVDCLPLGDTNMIYKERSVWAQIYVGAPYIFRFQRLSANAGMMAPGCAANTPLGHVVLSHGDIVLNDGNTVASIANGAVRDYLFNNLDSTYYKNSFVTVNPKRNEVWICFPYGSTSTCNRALVWNWIDKTWGVRTLTDVTYGAAGQSNVYSSSSLWSGDSGSWASDSTIWNQDDFSRAEYRMFMCHSTPYISLADNGNDDFGSTISSSLERTGIHFGEPYTVKTVRSIRPIIDGTEGATVSVEIGSSMVPDATPTWQAAKTFTVGSSVKIDSFTSGRFISVRFSSTDYPKWRIKSFEVDYSVTGAY